MQNKLTVAHFLALALLLFTVSACGKKSVNVRTTTQPVKIGKPYVIDGKEYTPIPNARNYQETGIASWYGKKFHGRLTANGERYNMYGISAAHPTLPLPTIVRVTNLDNRRSIVVRVNDRGPFVKNRSIDLSYAAAKELGYIDQGTARVRIESLDKNTGKRADTASPPLAPVYVQVGAFGSAINAQGLKDELNRSHGNASVSLHETDGQTLYRVRMGPYTDSRKIEQTVQTLRDSGLENMLIVTD